MQGKAYWPESLAIAYFSSFVDVDKKSVGELNGTFGRESTDTWKPWKYKSEKFKEKVEKKNIKLIDRAHVELLHLKK